jgi:hypothetical protein
MFNTGFFSIGSLILSWVIFSFFLEKIICWNALKKYYNQIVINDATHFDNKGELIDIFKENYNKDVEDNNNQEFNEDIELKVISPPRNFN